MRNENYSLRFLATSDRLSTKCLELARLHNRHDWVNVHLELNNI
jgi:hypothetical protein